MVQGFLRLRAGQRPGNIFSSPEFLALESKEQIENLFLVNQTECVHEPANQVGFVHRLPFLRKPPLCLIYHGAVSTRVIGHRKPLTYLLIQENLCNPKTQLLCTPFLKQRKKIRNNVNASLAPLGKGVTDALGRSLSTNRQYTKHLLCL